MQRWLFRRARGAHAAPTARSALAAPALAAPALVARAALAAPALAAPALAAPALAALTLAAVALAAIALAAGCSRRAPAEDADLELAMELAAPAAPFALTASDGSGLALTRVEARGVVEGPLTFTELHLYFHNPEARIREGTFAITLPPGASIARFAMEGDAGFLEAEVIGRSRARQVYEDFLHRRRDPALLERAAANLFTARVFPIAAGADKHLVISYASELAGGDYVLPLRGLPAVPRIDISVDVLRDGEGRERRELHERAWRPDRDFAAAVVRPAAVAAGALVAAEIAIGGRPVAVDAPRALTLLVDTSGSRAADFPRYARAVRELVEALRARYGGTLDLEIVAFDQEVRPIYAGPAIAYGDAQHAALIKRGAAGASDLGAALAWLAACEGPRPRVALVTDGVVTAGAAPPELVQKLARLRGQVGLERLDVVLAGGIRDEALAAQLARAGLARPGAVLDLDRGADDVAAGLGEAVLADVAIDVPGARWVSPRVLPAARIGQRVMVYAELAAPAREVEIVAGGARITLAPAAAARPLLERAIARARIEDDERELRATPDGPAAARLRAALERRAVAARVVSSQTSMLVLESDADYARYGIDRRALAEILVVGSGGLEAMKRKGAAPAPAPVDEAIREARRQASAPSSDRSIEARERAWARRQARLADDEPAEAAMALEEGKMGRRDSARASAEGQFAMRHATADPVLAREQAIEMARTAGILGSATGRFGFSGLRSGLDVSSGFDSTDVWTPPADTGAAEAGDSNGHLALRRPRDEQDDSAGAAPWTGRFAEVMAAIAAGHPDLALAIARRWHAEAPQELLALIALGEALEALGRPGDAARYYGSIIDLYPGRAELRRYAGARLERAADRGAAGVRALAIDTYRRAVADRPDHVTGHRLLAYALLRDGDPAAAFAAILEGVDRGRRDGQPEGIMRVLREDAGMIAAAYLAAGGPADEIRGALHRRDIPLTTQPSTRFVLSWETDANDVDLHVHDARGDHAWYEHRELASGGALYDDITTGYGPECFAIDGAPTAGPYRLSVHYYAQGAMGYGLGLLQILRFDGKGRIELEDRPYVLMASGARVELGEAR